MTRAIRERLTFANLTACLALFFALGGSVYAAATVGSDDIKSDAIEIRHLNFPVAGEGTSVSDPLASTGNFQTVAKQTIRVRDSGGSLLVNGVVEAANKGEAAASGDAVMRVLVDGQAEGPAFTSFLEAGSTDSSAGSFVCDGIPVGEHTVQLQALVPGSATIRDRTLTVSVLP